jgi:flagellar biosynthesis/type III secretory pathway protein FliH
MAVIRQSEAHRIARDAIVLDLGDLSRQAEGVRARAMADAEAILTKAASERQRLLAGARDEGLARGLEEGRGQGFEAGRKEGAAAALAERREALQKLETAWAAALEEFTRERERMLLDARQDVLKLAVMMGERIARRAVELDPSLITAQLEAVLGLLARPTRLTLAVGPADEALAREAVPALMARFPTAQHVDIVIDPSLTPGSCIARTAGGGTIDASIPTQLDRMVAALMPNATDRAAIGERASPEEARSGTLGATESPDSPKAAEGGAAGGT